MCNRKQILVVDDDESTRDFLDMVLTDNGYDVVQATDGAHALVLLESLQPDLIVLDMRMPAMDGWHFAAAYRQRPGPRAPIIVTTAGIDGPAYAAQIEADAYLDKPFAMSQLLTCVARCTSPIR